METVSRGATISWSIDRREGQPISGYNIYLTENPAADEFENRRDDHRKPYNQIPFPGDTDGDMTRETFDISHLENGKKYYVSVRTVGIGGIESTPSNEVSFTPLARGEFAISSNHSADNGGFSFDHEMSLPARDRRCDLYLYSRVNIVGLSSPSRLGAGLRKTNFIKTGNPGGVNHETIRINTGDKITARGKRGRAELIIKKIIRHDSEAEVTVGYVFYPAGYNPG